MPPAAPIPIAPCVLEGEHVRLEPLAPAHLPALVALGLDAELWRWTTTKIATESDMRRYLEAALRDAEAGVAVPFATVERASGVVVGSTRFGSIAREHRRVEIGWTWIARDRQRTAVNTEAKYLMLRHAFERWGCMRVELKTSALNVRSRAAILRLGATEEGTLRRHMVNQDGSIRDTVYFSIIEEEWPAVRAGLEAKLGRLHAG
jgi:RimJ/RimL family protein N-acetyltransferase